MGCAVAELDPTSKFAGMSGVWNWNAARNGRPVDFASCCSPRGFSPLCECASAPRSRP